MRYKDIAKIKRVECELNKKPKTCGREKSQEQGTK